MNKITKSAKGTDFILYLTCIIASAFGCLMVYSATRNEALESTIPIGRECLIMVVSAFIGIVLCIIISFFDYNSIERIALLVGTVCLLLILALFVWGEAPEDRPNARCWLPIIKTSAITVNFQPSELAKVGFLITFSAHLEKVRHSMDKFINIILLTAHAMVPIGLIILTDDLGSAIVFGFMFVGMMFAQLLSAQ